MISKITALSKIKRQTCCVPVTLEEDKSKILSGRHTLRDPNILLIHYKEYLKSSHFGKRSITIQEDDKLSWRSHTGWVIP